MANLAGVVKLKVMLDVLKPRKYPILSNKIYLLRKLRSVTIIALLWPSRKSDDQKDYLQLLEEKRFRIYSDVEDKENKMFSLLCNILYKPIDVARVSSNSVFVTFYLN